MSCRRKETFFTKVLVNERVCGTVIDSSIWINMASTYLVEKLNLPTFPHPKPYKFRWSTESEAFEVTEQVIISFTIGKYSDKVVCDVAPLLTCHLQLGQLWELSENGFYDSYTKAYHLCKKGKKFKVIPLPQHQINEERLEIQRKFLQWNKGDKQSGKSHQDENCNGFDHSPRKREKRERYQENLFCHV
ncbi:hypothetical protein ACH5RR_006775 [Cinchona calisaya]|uniref:Uncharacterized protein n=1 Tax=Cinchona calisaya TaxID=153742 RepID=A0ABD3AQE3_9GENT